MKVVSILLAPLDLIIESLLPDFSDALTTIQSYMNLPFTYVSWIFELVHVPSTALAMIVGYFVFKYAIADSVAGIRYAIKLYQKFKL